MSRTAFVCKGLGLGVEFMVMLRQMCRVLAQIRLFSSFSWGGRIQNDRQLGEGSCNLAANITVFSAGMTVCLIRFCSLRVNFAAQDMMVHAMRDSIYAAPLWNWLVGQSHYTGKSITSYLQLTRSIISIVWLNYFQAQSKLSQVCRDGVHIDIHTSPRHTLQSCVLVRCLILLIGRRYSNTILQLFSTS